MALDGVATGSMEATAATPAALGGMPKELGQEKDEKENPDAKANHFGGRERPAGCFGLHVNLIGDGRLAVKLHIC